MDNGVSHTWTNQYVGWPSLNDVDIDELFNRADDRIHRSHMKRQLSLAMAEISRQARLTEWNGWHKPVFRSWARKLSTKRAVKIINRLGLEDQALAANILCNEQVERIDAADRALWKALGNESKKVRQPNMMIMDYETYCNLSDHFDLR